MSPDPKTPDADADPFRLQKKIEREAVRSTNLAAIGFLEDGGVVEAEFHDGSLYRYAGVPREVFDRVLAAPSVGAVFRAEIVKVYTPRKIFEARPE